MDYTLQCLTCGKRYAMYFPRQTCDKCGGILEIAYIGNPEVRAVAKDFWSYEPLLPTGDYKHYKVGNTTLMKANEPDLYLKLELENPTKSFKDRGSVIEIAKALEYGYDEVVCASTGNMAYSVAYYAKLAGIKSTIFVSRNANWLKIRNIRETRDARIFKLEGDFTYAQRRAIDYAKTKDAFLVGDYGYRKEGQKTILYEVAAELPDVSNLFVPVGNATLFTALFKAIEELKKYGISRVSPRLIAVQASLTDPVALAYRKGRKVRYQKPRTDAGAIAVGYPTYGDMAVQAVKATNGTVVGVADAEMEEERTAFYRAYGLQAEMAAVASIAAFRKEAVRGKSVAIVSGGNTLKP